KYFRLFAGMVLILLVLKPFTGGLRLDDKLAYYFEAISFQKEASELSAQISDMESVRLKSMVSQYEEAVEHDLRTMAESSGFVCVKAKALIDGDEKNARFGHVVSVSLRLAPDSPGQTDQGNNTKIRPVES
ncbi:stage III sporulation protein AF, partial [Anaerotignum faecicola]|nr:stage III sporulation protein AF [Anaerotignum faecicola]